jgi:hypothetical protein
MPQKIYPWGKIPQYPQTGRLGGPQSWFEHFGEEKIIVLLPGIEFQSLISYWYTE